MGQEAVQEKYIMLSHTKRADLFCFRNAQYKNIAGIKKIVKGYLAAGNDKFHFGNCVHQIAERFIPMGIVPTFEEAETCVENFYSKFYKLVFEDVPEDYADSMSTFMNVHYGGVLAGINYCRRFLADSAKYEHKLLAFEEPMHSGKKPFEMCSFLIRDTRYKVVASGYKDYVLYDKNRNRIVGEIKNYAYAPPVSADEWNKIIDSGVDLNLISKKMRGMVAFFEMNHQIKDYVFSDILLKGMETEGMGEEEEKIWIFYDHVEKKKFLSIETPAFEVSDEDTDQRIADTRKKVEAILDYLKYYFSPKNKRTTAAHKTRIKKVSVLYAHLFELSKYQEPVSQYRERVKSHYTDDMTHVVHRFRYHYTLNSIMNHRKQIASDAQAYLLIAKADSSGFLMPANAPKDHYRCTGCEYQPLCISGKLELDETDRGTFEIKYKQPVVSDTCPEVYIPKN